MISRKPRPNGPAPALWNPEPGQSRHKAFKLARPGLAYIGPGLAWLTASGRAGTALTITLVEGVRLEIWDRDREVLTHFQTLTTWGRRRPFDFVARDDRTRVDLQP